MTFDKIITAVFSLLMFMIGVDKFMAFLTPCNIMASIPTTLWHIIGVLQIAAAFLIWLPRFRKIVAGFFLCLMIYFIVRHLMEGTYDIGGAVFLGLICGLLLRNGKTI